MDRLIFHIDCNSAFLSWEAVWRLQHGEKIDLRMIPSVIGGDVSKRHGIVLAKSIPAKKYGIRTAMTLFEAKNRCPDLAVIRPDYEMYIKCSNALLNFLKKRSPLVERYSIDECFVDMTGCIDRGKDSAEAAFELKEDIKKQFGFTVNIGVSNNKLLAKMASELKKPDMVHTMFPDEIKTKMWPLSVSELFCVGIKTCIKLYQCGITTIGQLAHTDPELLKYYFKLFGLMLWKFANGIDDSMVHSGQREIKGIGNSTTTPFDVADVQTARLFLLSLCETACMRLREMGAQAQVISVFVKNTEFKGYSRQKKLHMPVDNTEKIYKISCSLFEDVWQKEPLRLLSVRLTGLYIKKSRQMSIFDKKEMQKINLDKSIDAIRGKYGNNIITRASLIHSGVPNMTGGVHVDYPVMSNIL